MDMKSSRRINSMKLLLMVSPFIVVTFLFFYLPLFGWVYAFFDYKPGIPLVKTAFIGLKNFGLLFSSGSDLGNVMTNTAVMSTLTLLVTPFPVLFAIMLNEMKSGTYRKIAQTITTIPNFISWVLVFSIYFTFLSNEGFVNETLIKLGLMENPYSFLGDPKTAWFMQAFIMLWKNLGWSAIIYLAAITGIDGELYDAAEVDGAGRFHKILHVTIPGISSTFIVLLLLTISNFLNNGFEQYFMFYNPLVAEKLDVLDYYVYRVGLGKNMFSFATAIGIFKTLVSILLLTAANQISKITRGQTII